MPVAALWLALVLFAWRRGARAEPSVGPDFAAAFGASLGVGLERSR